MKEYNLIDFELEAAEPEATYEANRELNLAWRIVEETGANLFLTGRAGTGKTTFLRKLCDESDKRIVVTAPTGVAAINAKGTTLHSFFQLPFAPFIPGKGFLSNDKKYFNFSKQKRRIISSMSLLVIDEISMVRPDILDAIDFILRRYRRPTKPFGGVQLLLIGDLRQLPPVIKDEEWMQLSPYYSSPYFFDSHALKQAGYQSIELTTVYRQSDRDFVDILNVIRDGKLDMETLQRLNQRYIPGFDPKDDEGYIRLTTHNRLAASLNTSKMAALPTAPFTFEAEVSGDFPESIFPAEKSLTLKEGAQVMFIKNDVGAVRRYYNGLIGKITSISETGITVVPVNGGEEIEVEQVEWENNKYVIDETSKEITQETIGTFRQYPLKTAWAITIHKSQGLTFDKALIDAALSFAPGQTYVALSRCRSLEGMVLGSPIAPQAIITDHEVNSFIDYCYRNSPDSSTVDLLRGEYLRLLLAELFDFSNIRRRFEDFNRYVKEYIVPMYPSLSERCNEMQRIVSDEMEAVGAKFIKMYASTSIDPEAFGENVELKERIKRGCSYFIDKLKALGGFVNSLPKDIENKAYAERLNNTYEALWLEIRLKREVMTQLSDRDFSPAEYNNAYAESLLDLDIATDRAVKSAGRRQRKEKVAAVKTVAGVDDAADMGNPENQLKKEKKEKKEKKPKGYSTNETLKMFEAGKSIEQIAEERVLKPRTVVMHIRDLVSQGRLSLEAVVPEDCSKDIEEELKNRGERSFQEVLESLREKHPDMPDYYLSVMWIFKEQNISPQSNEE